MNMDQSKAIYDFTYDSRPRFNEELMLRDDDAIVNEIIKILYAYERNKFYIIKILNWKVLDNPIDITQRLWEYEQEKIDRNKSSGKKRDNDYDFVNLKDSAIKLIVVKYFVYVGIDANMISYEEAQTRLKEIKAIRNRFEKNKLSFHEKIRKEKEKEIQLLEAQFEIFEVLIQVPRLVDNYYLYINGGTYLPMYQIVDGSTYNNNGSTAKTSTVTFKTNFQPISMYRIYKELTDINNNIINLTYYITRTFNKSISAVKYLLGKYGYYEGLKKIGVDFIYLLNKAPENDDSRYIFEKNGIYIAVPKIILETEPVIQSIVATLYMAINKNTVYEDMFTNNYWVISLGQDFNKSTSEKEREKGERVLESLEGLYDTATKEALRLPDHRKQDTYGIILWMMREFPRLKSKDNLDVSIKRIRYAEYIASLYGMKISQGIHRISDNGRRAKAVSIKKVLNTNPDFLLTAIPNCRLVSYKNFVNDMDGIYALKFSYKGISGIGEKASSKVSINQRRVDVSYLGNLDIDSSSPGDPGLSGSLCPLSKVEDGFFKEFGEPDQWEEEFKNFMNEYKTLVGKKQVIIFDDLLHGTNSFEQLEELNDNINTLRKVFNPISIIGHDEPFCPITFI